MKNRKIKFRAWNGQDMIFLNSKTVGGHHVSLEFRHDEEYNWIIVDEIHKIIASSIHEDELMEFTGLHDKHGQEIYEQDIVKFRHRQHMSTEMTGSVAFSDEYFAFVIIWGEETFMLHDCDFIEILNNEFESGKF